MDELTENFSPLNTEPSRSSESFCFDSDVRRLGIFGGTFDPTHLEHLIAGERAVAEFRLDKLLFIPASIPPHKQQRTLASAADRLSMMQLATRNNPRFEVSDV